MTQSITTDPNQPDGYFNESAMVGMLGYALFMAFQLAVIFGPELALTNTATAFDFCFQRFVALACAAAFWILFCRHLNRRDVLVRSASFRIIGASLQILLPLFVIAESLFYLTIPYPVAIVAWMLWGIGYAMLSCSWIDAKSNLDESLATTTSYWSFAITACLVFGILALALDIAVYILLGTLLLSTVFLLIAPKNDAVVSDEHDLKWLRSQSKFRLSGSYVMLVDGALITLSASILVMAKPAQETDAPAYLVGTALVGTALLFYSLKRFNPAALSLERSQLIFLPVLVGGLTVMAYYAGIPSLVAAFILFVFLYLFDFVNLSILSLRGNLLGISPSYSFAHGRIFIIVGEAVGWFLAAVFFVPGLSWLLAPVVTALTVALCCYITVGALKPEQFPLIDGSPEERTEFETPPRGFRWIRRPQKLLSRSVFEGLPTLRSHAA